MNKPDLSRALREFMRLLTVLRFSPSDDRHVVFYLAAGRCYGFVSALYESGLISLEENFRLCHLVGSAVEHRREPLPDRRNGGPVMPALVRLERGRADREAAANAPAVQPVEAPADDPVEVPTPVSRLGLYLLCLLGIGRTGLEFQPVATSRPKAPRADIRGHWRHATDRREVAKGFEYLPCGTGLYLRACTVKGEAGKVVVQDPRQRQTRCPSCRSTNRSNWKADGMTAPVRGWGFPALARKAHYFVNGTSLCRGWWFTGELVDQGHALPDNCATCMRLRLRKQQATENGD
ncbi:hypothetical protein [Stutzerimonas kirkiae]|nr:hypothetical protein [Stutzerimonas kirkiae]